MAVKRILFLLLLPIGLFAQQGLLNKRIDISLNDISIKEALKNISDIANIEFSYNPDIIANNTLVSVNYKNEALSYVIKAIISDSTILAKEVENQIILYKRNKNKTAESKLISGRIVYEETMKPVPYANVWIKDEYSGTICNEAGIFELEVESKNFSDTIIISALGYKKFACPVTYFFQTNDIIVLLEDSVFQIDEVTILNYNHLEALYWTTAESNSAYLLTFATQHEIYCENYLNYLKEIFHQPSCQGNTYIWKNKKIDIIASLKANIKFRYFKCPYCPLNNDFTVTLELADKKGRNLLLDVDLRKPITAFFQNILNKSFAEGVNHNQLKELNGYMCLEGLEQPYTGGCYAFYKNGKKSLSGYYINGKKDGEWKNWFSNEQLGKHVFYKNGKLDGNALFWYKNGQKKIKSNYVNGQKNGDLTYWYKNGRLRLETHFTNDKLNGLNKFWNHKGTLLKEANYKNGRIYGWIEYNKRGKIIDKQGEI